MVNMTQLFLFLTLLLAPVHFAVADNNQPSHIAAESSYAIGLSVSSVEDESDGSLDDFFVSAEQVFLCRSSRLATYLDQPDWLIRHSAVHPIRGPPIHFV